MYDARAIIYLALISMVIGGTARADDTTHEDFENHFFKACMPFVLSGGSPDSYVQHAVSRVHVGIPGQYDKIVEVRKLEPADPNLVPDTLHGQTGRVFVQNDQFTPMTLTLADDGVCAVAARDMPGIEELVATTEKRLTSFSSRFNKTAENTLYAADGSAIESRQYTADVNGHKFLVVLSTTPTPGLVQVGQAVVTVSKTADK